MFGKNYDEEISKLRNVVEIQIKNVDQLTKNVTDLMDMYTEIQKQMIQMAKNVANQKQCITFLLKHTTVDTGGMEDFAKMLKNIADTNKVGE